MYDHATIWIRNMYRTVAVFTEDGRSVQTSKNLLSNVETFLKDLAADVV